MSGHLDLCILDWDLPRMTGIAACRWIRSVELKVQPYIVLLTEKNQPEQIQMAYMAGANDFIAKPLNLEDLDFLVSNVRAKGAAAGCGVSPVDPPGSSGTLPARPDSP
jgi:DNA-binding response OmpR family regulator